MNFIGLTATISIAVVFAYSQQINAQTGIRGTLIDKQTNETLTGVTVAVDDSKKGTSTDANGVFVISNLEPGQYKLTFSCIGYSSAERANIVVSTGQMTDLGNLVLEESPYSLAQITVTPGSFSIMGEGNLSRQTMTQKDIENMSWAEDITRVVARLPGISSSDFSSKFSIRGGENDEVLINLDGMELYDPFHQRDYSGGLFSIVDIKTIQGIDLMTGGFSAEYGNRMSGVFNMRTKKVADNQRHTSLGLGVMNGRVYTEGKFSANKGSYIFSARRSMLDLLFRAVGETEALPSFYDSMLKLEYQLSDKHTLSLHALQAGDKLKIRDISDEMDYDINDTKYNNSYTWLTLKSYYSSNLSSRTILYGALINHQRLGSFLKYEATDKGNFALDDQRDHSFAGLKQDWNWQASNSFFFNAGFDFRPQKATFDHVFNIDELRSDPNEVLYQYQLTRDIHTSKDGEQVAAYLSGRIKLTRQLILETGLRYDRASYSGDDLWSPRAALAYAFSENTFLRGAWGYYYQSQFMNNLAINDGITSYFPAELAKHYVLGFQHKFNSGLDFRVEAYHKDLSNLSPISQNTRDHLEIFPEQRNDYLRVFYNGATSKGIEFFFKYDTGGKYTYWFSYALAKATDDISSIDYYGLLSWRPGKVPRLNDQRHTVYADVNYRPNDKWHFNGSFQFYRGWPRTDYTYHYQALPNDDLHFYPVHGEFNAVIYPAYHRMDIRANRRWALKHGDLTAFMHVINLYNRKNLKKFDLDATNDEDEYSIDAEGNYVPVRDDKYWFGLLPVFGVSWDF